jgi:hypothetical protein
MGVKGMGLAVILGLAALLGGGLAVATPAPTCMVTFTPTDTPFGEAPRNCR